MRYLDGPVSGRGRANRTGGDEEVFDIISGPAYFNFVANDLIVHNPTYAALRHR